MKKGKGFKPKTRGSRSKKINVIILVVVVLVVLFILYAVFNSNQRGDSDGGFLEELIGGLFSEGIIPESVDTSGDLEIIGPGDLICGDGICDTDEDCPSDCEIEIIIDPYLINVEKECAKLKDECIINGEDESECNSYYDYCLLINNKDNEDSHNARCELARITCQFNNAVDRCTNNYNICLGSVDDCLEVESVCENVKLVLRQECLIGNIKGDFNGEKLPEVHTLVGEDPEAFYTHIIETYGYKSVCEKDSFGLLFCKVSEEKKFIKGELCSASNDVFENVCFDRACIEEKDTDGKVIGAQCVYTSKYYKYNTLIGDACPINDKEPKIKNGICKISEKKDIFDNIIVECLEAECNNNDQCNVEGDGKKKQQCIIDPEKEGYYDGRICFEGECIFDVNKVKECGFKEECRELGGIDSDGNNVECFRPDCFNDLNCKDPDFPICSEGVCLDCFGVLDQCDKAVHDNCYSQCDDLDDPEEACVVACKVKQAKCVSDYQKCNNPEPSCVDGSECSLKEEICKDGICVAKLDSEIEVIKPTEDPIRIILDKLKDGEIVIIGNDHSEENHEEYFEDIVQKASDEGIEIVIALEGPSDSSVEDNLDIPGDKSGEGNDYEIVFIDHPDAGGEIRFDENDEIIITVPDDKTRDEHMADKIDEIASENQGTGVLVFVGSDHLGETKGEAESPGVKSYLPESLQDMTTTVYLGDTESLQNDLENPDEVDYSFDPSIISSKKDDEKSIDKSEGSGTVTTTGGGGSSGGGSSGGGGGGSVSVPPKTDPSEKSEESKVESEDDKVFESGEKDQEDKKDEPDKNIFVKAREEIRKALGLETKEGEIPLWKKVIGGILIAFGIIDDPREEAKVDREKIVSDLDDEEISPEEEDEKEEEPEEGLTDDNTYLVNGEYVRDVGVRGEDADVMLNICLESTRDNSLLKIEFQDPYCGGSEVDYVEFKSTCENYFDWVDDEADMCKCTAEYYCVGNPIPYGGQIS